METIDLKKAKKINQVDASAKSSTKVGKKNATDEKTAKVIKERVAKEKDPMYQYGETTGPEKKKFRAAARRAKATWMKEIEKETDADKKAKLIKKANKWAHEVYTKEHMVTFE